MVFFSLDKDKPNKNEMSNYRPVSILKTFTKIYERVVKDQLVSGLEKYFSLFICAYRKGYNTKHILARLIEECREQLDRNCTVGTIFMNLS